MAVIWKARTKCSTVSKSCKLTQLSMMLLRYGMVWYSMVWYGMVWYGMVLFGIPIEFAYEIVAVCLFP